MASTRRSGINARIYIDDTAGGTAAVGTGTLTLLTAEASYTIDQSRNLINVTSFGDAVETNVAGLRKAAGSITGFQDFANNNIFNAFSSSTERGLMIFPDYTNQVGTYFSGKAFFSPKFGASVDGAATEDFDFTSGPSGMDWTHP